MKQSLGLVSLVVRDYDEALAFFVGKLGFLLVEDSFVSEQTKRWVVITPPGAIETRLLLARASTPDQASRIGAQTGGRVFLFLYTDNLWRDYERYKAQGIIFVREPKAIHFSYQRYLTNRIREGLGFGNVPIRLVFRLRHRDREK
jgi:catechol 2,3-dioxygenase-like lactoylglutathione lyase family enzyme